MNIGLIAHDSKKTLMQKSITRNKERCEYDFKNSQFKSIL